MRPRGARGLCAGAILGIGAALAACAAASLAGTDAAPPDRAGSSPTELWRGVLASAVPAFCEDAPPGYAGVPEDGYRYLCARLRVDEAWYRARFLDGSYAKVADAVRAIEAARGVKKVFYPFAGPDLPAPFAIFPEAEEVLAVALEEPGDPAAPFSDPEARNAVFPYPTDTAAQVEESALTKLFISYTAHLWAGYSTMEHIEEVGLAPTVIVQAARLLGATIVSVHRFRLSADGGIEEVSPDDSAGGGSPEGLQVRFRFGPPSARRECLYRYVRWNLDDGHFSSESPAARHIRAFGFEGVLVKAASELLPRSGFSNVRRLILERARVIVDDAELDPVAAEVAQAFETHLVPIGPLSFGYLAAHDGNRVPVRVRERPPSFSR